MTVRFNQFVAGRRSGKTTLLVSQILREVKAGNDVSVLTVNKTSADALAQALLTHIKADGHLSWGMNQNGSNLYLSVDNMRDICSSCGRGDSVSGKIHFFVRSLVDRHFRVSASAVGSRLFIDDVEFLANDSETLEESVQNAIFEFVLPDQDLDVLVTTSGRPLELSGTLTL